MGVFDRVLHLLVIRCGEGEHQAGDQVEPAAEVIEFADGGERCERGDRNPGGLDFERLQCGDLILTKRVGAGDVNAQRQHLRCNAWAHKLRIRNQLIVPILLSLPGFL